MAWTCDAFKVLGAGGVGEERRRERDDRGRKIGILLKGEDVEKHGRKMTEARGEGEKKAHGKYIQSWSSPSKILCVCVSLMLHTP